MFVQQPDSLAMIHNNKQQQQQHPQITRSMLLVKANCFDDHCV